ncbi:MAG: DUF6702 family protein [Bacteroidia bacterium]
MCSAVIFSSYTVIHRYYFSMSEIKIDTKKKTVSVSCKLFTNDLEEALAKLNNKKVDLAKSVNDKDVQLLLFNYLNERFKLSFGTSSVKLKFVGFENEDDVTWCYMESKLETKSSKNIKVFDTLLYDFLPDETNLIQMEWDGSSRTEKLVNPNKEVLINF